MKRIPKTVMVSEENARFLDSIPRGLKGTIIDALLLAIREEFKEDPEKAVMWAFSFIQKAEKIANADEVTEKLDMDLANVKLIKSD